MLETPRGILRALPIAEACTRTTALFFDSGDFTAATGAAITANALLFARSAISTAAGSVGIRPVALRDGAHRQRLPSLEAAPHRMSISLPKPVSVSVSAIGAVALGVGEVG